MVSPSLDWNHQSLCKQLLSRQCGDLLGEQRLIFGSLSVSMSRVSSLHRRCSILEALAAGYKFAKWGLPLSNKLDSSKSEAGIANSLGIEDIDFSTWINGCYRQALTQCEIGEDEDVICLSKIATAFGAEFLLHR